MVVQRPGRLALEYVSVERRIRKAAPETPVKRRADVAHAVQLVPDPRLADVFRIARDFFGSLLRQRVVHGLGRGHARLHRGMDALDLGYVEEPRGIADEHASGEGELGQGLESALGNRARAVGNAPAVFEKASNRRVRLEALEFVERTDPGIFVIQADDKTNRHLVVIQMVEEGAAVGAPVHGPAGGVDDQARLVALRLHLPQLLDADAVGLRVDALAQLEFLHQALGQRAAGALGENRLFCVQLHAGLVILRVLAVAAYAQVAGGHALDRAVLVVEHLGRGEAGVDLDAQPLGLLSQPAAQIAETDDVVAVIVHLRRRRQPERLALGKKQEAVFPGGRIEGRTQGFTVGEEFVEGARFKHRAGEDVGADLGAFLDQADVDVAAFFGGELLQADGARQPRGPAADDHHIVFHRFALHVDSRFLVAAARVERRGVAASAATGTCDRAYSSAGEL